MLTLTRGETLVLCGDLEHAPDCVYSGPAIAYFRSPDGSTWADAARTIPYVIPKCGCGYFDMLESARAKLRASLTS